MQKSLRILNVEDSERDSSLLKRHLISAQYELTAWQRVDTPDEMLAALESSEWDIVLCDYAMPRFDALKALALLRQTGIDVPFIIISGTVGEEVAVEAMLSGAHDYLSKDNLVRLVPAIERELKEAQNRRGLRESETARSVSEARYRALFDYAPDGIIISGPDDYYLDANASMCAMLGYEHRELVGLHASDIVIRSEARELDSEFALVQSTPDYNREWHFKRKDGSVFPAEVIATIMPDGNLLAMIRDISERNHTAESLRVVAREKDESLALIDTILSRAPIGFAFHDRDMRYVRINGTLADINGLSVEQHLGQTPHHILPKTAPILEPLIRGVLETGEPVIDYELRGETLAEPGAAKDWIASFYPVGIEGGEVIGVGVLVTDITEHKKAEDELRESEYLLAASQRITHLGSWVMELSDAGEWQKERWSDEHYRIFGFEPGEFEITDENFYKCIHPDDRERLAKTIADALEDQESFDIEHRIILPDGSERIIHAIAEMVVDPKTGKPQKLVGSVQDITERRNAEEALRATEERYRELVENALDIIYTHDLEGNYTSVNKAAETLTGFTKDEILAMNIADAISSEDLETAKNIVGAKLAGEDAPAHEVELLTKDGNGVMVEVNSRIIYENGIPIGVQGIARDITERKRAEATLLESDEKFRQLADNITDVFWIRSPDMSKIYYISPAYEQIWGRKLRSDYADPHEWQDFIVPEDRQRVKKAYAGLMGDETKIEVEFRILRPDGEQRWLRAKGFQVKDASGEVIRLAGINTDITQTRQAGAEMEQMLQRLKDAQRIGQIGDFTWDKATGAITWSHEIFEIVGRDPQLGPPKDYQEMQDYFDTPSREVMDVKTALAIGSGESQEYELVAVRPDGERVYIQAMSEPRKDSGGEVLGLRGTIQNISIRKEAEASLERSEIRYHSLFENMIEGYAYCETVFEGDKLKDFVYTEVNGAMEKLTGLTDVVGKKVSDVVPGLAKTNPEVFEVFGRVALTGEPEKIETYLEPLEIWLSIAVYSSSRENFVAVFDNITERKRAGSLLIESQQRLALATESASIGIWDWDLVADTMKWDARMYDLYGNHDEDFAGSSQTWNLNLHPEDVERVYAEYAAVIEGTGEYHSEFRVVWPNGEVRHLESSATILRAEDGTALRFIGVNWDITERKVAEETLREADQRAIREYGLLLNRVAKLALALGDARDLETVYEELCEFAFVSTGMDGFFISLFDAKQKTRTAAYVWSEGVKVDAPSLPPMEMGKSPHSRAVLTGETIITDDFQNAMDGQPVIHLNGDLPQSSLVVPMSVMGKIVGGVEVQSNHLAAFTDSHATAMQMAANLAANAIENVRLLDIERVQAEQLRQSQKMEAIGVLAGGIAHDFNNLLTAINGFSDLTLRKMEPNNPFRHSIQEIGKAGRRAAELTSQLLTFSRKQVLVPSVINLNSVVSNIEAMLRRVIRESIELKVKLEPKLGNVMADPGQVEQVIMNLAINARDAMPDGGHLTIETKNVYLDANYVEQHFMVSGGHFVRMTITDTGEGMDAMTRSHIFEPFFTTKEVGKGTGLGLATVYGIVKQSGGTISVYSEVGHGSSFRVYLPCVDQEVEQPSWPSEVEAMGAGTETILLVEDEDAVRSFVTEVLEDSGYKVLPAENGPNALTLCQNYSEPIDLLISDVIMPKMGGAELKNQVVNLIPGIKVLFISGYTNDSMAGRGIDDPNLAFLEKPFTPDSLTRKVREVLEREVSN